MLEYLCIILPVAVLAVAHLLRVRCLKQQLQESLGQRLEDRVKERTRIARELHDSLFQVPGMRERVLEFGGKLQVWSQRNAGTEIELKIGGRIAYAHRPRAALFMYIARES